MNNRKGGREKQLAVLRLLKSCSSPSSNTSFLPATDTGLHVEVSSSLLGQVLIPGHVVGCRCECSREECPIPSRWLGRPSARGSSKHAYSIAGLSWNSCPTECCPSDGIATRPTAGGGPWLEVSMTPRVGIQAAAPQWALSAGGGF